jgi:hypothetical protein
MPVRSWPGKLLGCGITEAMMGDTAIIVGKPSFKSKALTLEMSEHWNAVESHQEKTMIIQASKPAQETC